jgi:hypothetical protein
MGKKHLLLPQVLSQKQAKKHQELAIFGVVVQKKQNGVWRFAPFFYDFLLVSANLAPRFVD